MTQVEKCEAQTGALAEVFCQPSELLKLSVMHYKCPTRLSKSSTAFFKRGDIPEF